MITDAREGPTSAIRAAVEDERRRGAEDAEHDRARSIASAGDRVARRRRDRRRGQHHAPRPRARRPSSPAGRCRRAAASGSSGRSRSRRAASRIAPAPSSSSRSPATSRPTRATTPAKPTKRPTRRLPVARSSWSKRSASTATINGHRWRSGSPRATSRRAARRRRSGGTGSRSRSARRATSGRPRRAASRAAPAASEIASRISGGHRDPHPGEERGRDAVVDGDLDEEVRDAPEDRDGPKANQARALTRRSASASSRVQLQVSICSPSKTWSASASRPGCRRGPPASTCLEVEPPASRLRLSVNARVGASKSCRCRLVAACPSRTRPRSCRS